MRPPASQPWWVQLAYPHDQPLRVILGLILLSAFIALLLGLDDRRRAQRPKDRS